MKCIESIACILLAILMALSLFSCGGAMPEAPIETPSATPETVTPAQTESTTPDYEEENVYEKYLQYIYVLDDTYDMYWDNLNHENILRLKEIGEMQWLSEQDTARIDKEWAKELIDYKLKKILNTENTEFLSYELNGYVDGRLKSLIYNDELYVSYPYYSYYKRLDGVEGTASALPMPASTHLLIPLWVLTDVIQ